MRISNCKPVNRFRILKLLKRILFFFFFFFFTLWIEFLIFSYIRRISLIFILLLIIYFHVLVILRIRVYILPNWFWNRGVVDKFLTLNIDLLNFWWSFLRRYYLLNIPFRTCREDCQAITVWLLIHQLFGWTYVVWNHFNRLLLRRY